MRESFFICFFSLVRLSLDIEDKFLKMKLIRQINRFFDCFIKIEKEEGDSVAQYSQAELLKTTDEIIEFIEMLAYLKVLDLSPTLKAQKNILAFKSKFLDFQISVVNKVFASRQATPLVKLPKRSKVKISRYDKEALSEKIVSFVENAGESSAKEIIVAFASQVTKRTIQRYLTSLVKTNKLRKKGNSNTLKYSLI